MTNIRLIMLTISLIFSYNAIASSYIECENPFLLHDIYYGAYDGMPKDISPESYWEMGLAPCKAVHEIKNEYKILQTVRDMKEEGLPYPIDYKALYEFIDFVHNSNAVKKEDIAEFNEVTLPKYLRIEGFVSLEELEKLAQENPESRTKGSDLYFYSFPPEIFFEEESHTILQVGGKYDVTAMEMDSSNDHAMAEFYKILPMQRDMEILNFGETYEFNNYFYLDYSLFMGCLGSEDVLNCMEHNFILTSYFARILDDNEPYITSITNGHFLGGMEGARIEIMEKVVEKAGGDLEDIEEMMSYFFKIDWRDYLTKEEKIDIFYNDFIDYTFSGNNHLGFDGNKILATEGMLNKDDFYQYLRKDAIRDVPKHLSSKELLAEEYYKAAALGEARELTRQEKLAYIYFSYFENEYPNFIKEREYAAVSAFYYGKEDLYQALYDVQEGQDIKENESPLYYSVLYNLLEAQEERVFNDLPVIDNNSIIVQEEGYIHVDEQEYTSADLSKICTLYNESLDKVLSAATAEKRAAFESQNINFCVQ